MGAVTVKMQGSEEMKKILKEFRNDTFKKKVLTSTYRKAGKPFIELAKAKAPVAEDWVFRKQSKKGQQSSAQAIAPGTLRESIGAWTYGKLNQPHLFLGVRTGKRAKKNDGWFFKFLEFGTVYINPQPFLQPAWDNTKGAISNAAISSFGKTFKRFKRNYNL